MSPPEVLVGLDAATRAYGTQVLLDAVSLGVRTGDRIGVVGPNGAGKSTLLALLAGAQTPDAGRVWRMAGVSVGLLAQGDPGGDDPAALGPALAGVDLPGVDLSAGASTVGEYVVGGREVHEWAGDARVRSVLDGLFGGVGMPGLPQGPTTSLATLSGGERRRVQLARLLVGRTDQLLVLDEPTNHLDLEAVGWLAEYLTEAPGLRRGALVVATHDRWFLDAACRDTWEVHDGTVDAYEGGYAAYVLARAERARIASATEARRANLLRKELAWLRRGAPARTSKPRFRLDAAATLIADEPPPRDRVALAGFAAARLGRTVLELEDVSLRLGGRSLLEQVTWRLGPGDRVGVVGANGAGKTSLLRLLVGQLAPQSGRVVRGASVVLGYLPQAGLTLDPGLRALEAVEQVAREVTIAGRTVGASSLLETFGLGGQRSWTRLGELSGGQRRRVGLLCVLMGGANVLVLDEPTNDLDVETLTALEDVLDSWAGTLVVVTHDRYVLERVTDRVVGLFGDGQVRDLPGGVDEFLRRRAELATRNARGAGSAPLADRPAPPRADAAGLRAAGKELTRIERALARLEAVQVGLHEQMVAHATDHERLARLNGELMALAEERARLEETWLAVGSALEEAAASDPTGRA
ncbi:MAG: ABC-F family ATP-binding cassette domain-containing protein [Actinomycetes bacterium]